MGTSTIKENGRVRYIEPNDLEKTGSGRNIPEPYENYNVFVDLTVNIPDRNNCGEDTSEEITFSTSNGNISFMNGENGNLTTSYTDISYANPKPGGNKESLGIESINISYDKNLFPIVTIKFIDVRGASLMSAQELSYYDLLKSKDGGNGSAPNPGSFFKALMTIPSPVFSLKVKGYYGREITFKLALLSFKANFDNDSGNFIITTQFIGHMYGIFTDLPLTYITIAPYMKYIGKSYWDHKKQLNFTYEGSGAPIYTFPQLIYRLDKYKDEMGKKEFPDFKANASTRLNYLNTILISLNSLLDKLNERFHVSIYSNVPKNGLKDANLIMAARASYTPKNAKTMFDDIDTNFSGKIEDSGNRDLDSEAYNQLYVIDFADFENEYNELRKNIKLYNESYNDNMPYPYFMQKEDPKQVKIDLRDKGLLSIINKDNILSNKDITSINYYTGNVTNKDGGIEFDEDFFENKKMFQKIIDIPKTVSRDNYGVFIPCLIGSDGGFYNKLTEDLSTYTNIAKESDKTVEAFKESELIKALGFTPTIENTFKMIFAHIETFMACFYECISNIKRKRRKAEDLKSIIDFKETDLPLNSEFVPPFPKITKTDSEGKTSCMWVGDIFGPNFDPNEYFEEIALVESMMDACQMFEYDTESNDASYKNSSNRNSENYTFLPTSPADLKNYVKDPMYNPYSYINLNTSGENIREDFFMRAILRLLYGIMSMDNINQGDYLLSCKGLGKAEAINFINANSFSDGVGKLLKEDLSFNAFFNYLTNKGGENNRKTWEIHQANNSVINRDGKYNWISIKDEKTGNNNLVFPYKILETLSMFKSTIVKDNILNGYTDNWVSLSDDLYLENQFFIRKDNGTDNFNDLCRLLKGDNDMENANDFLKLMDKKNCKIYKKYKSFVDNSVLSDILDEEAVLNYGIKEPTYKNINGERISFGFSNKVGKNLAELSNEVDKMAHLTFPTLAYFNGNKNPENIYFVPYNSSVDKDFTLQNTLEKSNGTFMKIQNNDFSAAYYLIMSLPIDMEEAIRKIRERKRIKCVDLLEGAFWWRYKSMENNGNDPIIPVIDNIAYDIPNREEIAKCMNLQGAYLRSVTNREDYINLFEVFKKNDLIHKERIDAFIKYFEDWANSEFVTINEFMLNKDNYSPVSSANDKIYSLNENANSENINEMFSLFYSNNINGSLKVNKDSVNKQGLQSAYNEFISAIKKEYNKDLKNWEEKINEQEKETRKSPYASPNRNNKDMKISTYLVLKALYEKWFNSVPFDKWCIGSDKSEYKNFIVIDGLYRDIKDKLHINADNFGNLVGEVINSNSLIEKTENNTKNYPKSVYTLFSSIAEKHGMNFLAFPQQNGFANPKSLEGMFDAHFVSIDDSDRESNENCYIFVYPSSKSEHLDMGGDSQYPDDGVYLTDENISIMELASDRNNGKYYIPAFGVTYGRENQSFFRRISIGMESPQVTEASIMAQMSIASKAGNSAKESGLYGQDLYKVFSAYSYNCTVDMLGNMQVMPLMYFQLNNIPMFKGAYMIYKVEHTITLNDVNTTFSGYRISNNSLNLADTNTDFITPEDINGAAEKIKEYESKYVENLNHPETKKNGKGSISRQPTSGGTSKSGSYLGKEYVPNSTNSGYVEITRSYSSVDEIDTSDIDIKVLILDRAHGQDVAGKRSPNTDKTRPVKKECDWSQSMCNALYNKIEELKEMPYSPIKNLILDKYPSEDVSCFGGNYNNCGTIYKENEPGINSRCKHIADTAKTYGSKSVMCLSPHLNGAGSGEDWARLRNGKDFIGYWGAYTYSEGVQLGDLLAECFIKEAQKFIPNGKDSPVVKTKVQGTAAGILKTPAFTVICENLFQDSKSNYDYIYNEYPINPKGSKNLFNTLLGGILNFLNTYSLSHKGKLTQIIYSLGL